MTYVDGMNGARSAQHPCDQRVTGLMDRGEQSRDALLVFWRILAHPRDPSPWIYLSYGPSIVKSIPSDVVAYRRTAEFTEHTVPDALRRGHSTKAGVWGRIAVLTGRLRYRILEPKVEEQVLTPEFEGVVEPGVSHEVEPLGEVRFFVEFLRRDPG